MPTLYVIIILMLLFVGNVNLRSYIAMNYSKET